MRKMLPVIALATVAALCGDAGLAQAKKPEPQLPDAALEAVVRIDMNGSIRGSGVVVSASGYVVTSLGQLGGYEYATAITVGEQRSAAKVFAIDKQHQLIVLKTAAPQPRWATLEFAGTDQKGGAEKIVGFADTNSTPSMIERRSRDATVYNPHFSGQSSSDLDLSDLLITKVKNDNLNGIKRDGATLFQLSDGRVAGIVIGDMRVGETSALIAIPASTVRTFLTSKGIALPSE